MTIRAGCPACKQPVECPPDLAGQVMPCPGCGQRMRVPGTPPVLVARVAEEGRHVGLIDTEGDDNPFADLARDEAPVDPAGPPPAGVAKDVVGEPLRAFASSGQGWFILIGVGLLLVGVLLLGVALTTRTIRLVPAAGCVAVLLGGALVYFGVTMMGRRVVVCEKGFADCGPLGSSACGWGQVRSIHQTVIRVFNGEAYSHTHHEYAVVLEDGKALSYDNAFDDVGALGRAIQRGVARAKLPQAVADLEAGRAVEFADLRISRSGIGHGGESLRWDEVGAIDAKNDVLVITRRSGGEAWASVEVPRIPNVALFSQVVGHA